MSSGEAKYLMVSMSVGDPGRLWACAWLNGSGSTEEARDAARWLKARLRYWLASAG
jgi:hypothetical protein